MYTYTNMIHTNMNIYNVYIYKHEHTNMNIYNV